MENNELDDLLSGGENETPKTAGGNNQSFEELIQEFEQATRKEPANTTFNDPNRPVVGKSLADPQTDETLRKEYPNLSFFVPPDLMKEVQGLRQFANGVQMEREQAQADRDMDSAAKFIKEEKGINAPDKLIRSFLRNEFFSDQRFNNAFLNRSQNPHGWESAIKRAAKSLDKELSSQPDPEVTADRDAIASAVLAAGSRTPTPEKSHGSLNKMTDREFNTHLKDQGIW